MSSRDPKEPVAVILLPVLFERFKVWLDREVNADAIMVPDLPPEEMESYFIAPRNLGPTA